MSFVKVTRGFLKYCCIRQRLLGGDGVMILQEFEKEKLRRKVAKAVAKPEKRKGCLSRSSLRDYSVAVMANLMCQLV